MTRKDNESPWKNVLKCVLPDFMKFCFADVADQIDWSLGYTSLDKEFQAISRFHVIGKRIADILFKVWLKSGEEIWLLLHLELQMQEDVDFPERMYIYNYRIFDRYHHPVMSVAILADNNPYWHPTNYTRSAWNNRLHFEFATVKLLDYVQQKSKLMQSTNPFAIIILAHLAAFETQQHPPSRLQSKLAISRALFKKRFSKDYILNLLYFIDWILALPAPIELDYLQAIEQEEEEQVSYITSFERIYTQRGQRVFLQRLLQRRFGSLSSELQQQLAQANDDQLVRWGDRLLDAKNLDDIFEFKQASG